MERRQQSLASKMPTEDASPVKSVDDDDEDDISTEASESCVMCLREPAATGSMKSDKGAASQALLADPGQKTAKVSAWSLPTAAHFCKVCERARSALIGC